MEAHNTTTVSFWQFSCMSVWVCCAMPHFHFHAHKLYLNLQLNKLDIKNWFKLFAIVLCVCKQFNVANNAYAIDAIHMPVDLILILKKKNYFLFVPLSDSHRLRCLSYFMVWIVNESDFQLNNIQRQCDNHAISKLNSAIFNAHN